MQAPLCFAAGQPLCVCVCSWLGRVDGVWSICQGRPEEGLHLHNSFDKHAQGCGPTFKQTDQVLWLGPPLKVFRMSVPHREKLLSYIHIYVHIFLVVIASAVFAFRGHECENLF